MVELQPAGIARFMPTSVAKRYLMHSPVSDSVRRRGRVTSNLVATGVQLAARAVGVFSPHIAEPLHEELVLAGARIAQPDILKLNERGVNIGLGIRVRRVLPRDIPESVRGLYDHLTLLEASSDRSGYLCYFGVHSLMPTRSGRLMAAGGTRIRGDYPDKASAMRDALRLSRAMTYKCAGADIATGGAKYVIVHSNLTPIRRTILRDHAITIEFLEANNTGQDMNIGEDDAVFLAYHAPHTIIGEQGLSMGGVRPAEPTARGVAISLEAAARLLGMELRGLRVTLQGLGNVGEPLVPLLLGMGVQLTVTDFKVEKRAAIAARFEGRVTVVEPDAIYDAPGDVFMPCAKEDLLFAATIRRLAMAGYKLVLGSANNPLKDEKVDGALLRELRMRFVTDFIANAGGVIGVASGYVGYDVDTKLRDVGLSTAEALRIGEGEIPDWQAGYVLAERRIEGYRERGMIIGRRD